MRSSRLIFFVAIFAEALVALAPAQESTFELPVQLIGFPVIIMAVRLSNFFKKLAYSLNPRTYARRSRRETAWDPSLNVMEVEKKLVKEFGANVCVFERVCAHYAELTESLHGSNHILDWDTVFGEYKAAPSSNKQNYLLSVFLGDIVASPNLCHALAKRGRACRGAIHGPEDTSPPHAVVRKGNLTQPSHRVAPVHHNARRVNHTTSRRIQFSDHHVIPDHHGNHRDHSNHGNHRRRVFLDHPAQVPRRH